SAGGRGRDRRRGEAHREGGRRRQDVARGAVAREVRVRGAARDGGQDGQRRGAVRGADRQARLDQRVLRALRQGHARRREAGGGEVLRADQPDRRHPEGGQQMRRATATKMASARPRTLARTMAMTALATTTIWGANTT